MPDFQLRPHNDHWIGTYAAMASTCEIIIDSNEQELAQKLTHIAQQETLRIQQKFSRYQKDNLLWQINHANGAAITVDSETAHLLDFADQCFQLSDGYFDITSGCLRRAWTFDGSNNLPSEESVNALLPFIGWQKVRWKKDHEKNTQLQMPAGMEIDFGGIGKEYAVDSVLRLLSAQTNVPILVNFGGDLAVTGARKNGAPWQVGIESLDVNEHNNQPMNKQADKILEISAGALATSGDSRRFLIANNQRYGHILNPFTGWPIIDAPRSVTVAGSNCIQAGMLATFALLKGKEAEEFLKEQGVPFWLLK
jgi:thiamine biosynthesis lipoprotein